MGDAGIHGNGTGREEEKGRRFLELVDRQSTLQQAIASKLTRLISEHGWDSDALRAELADLVAEHSQVTGEINGLDAGA
ncbi:MAG: hypothetical protein MI749_19740 [Desulfovibrionales bacterium]|nr:hypothetical protein [Desulfovibrionales bacterium]